MYARIHNWTKHCEAAANLEYKRLHGYGAAPAESEAERFSLVNDVLRSEFAVRGDEVLVTRHTRSEVVNSWTKTRDEARAYWETLTAQGYTRFQSREERGLKGTGPGPRQHAAAGRTKATAR